jgi:hypothetical protein
MRGYEKRGRGGVVQERVTNLRPGTWRDEELRGWVATREALNLQEGWHVIADDGDDGSATDAALPGDHVEVGEVLAAADKEQRRRQRQPAAGAPAGRPVATSETPQE